MNNILSNKTASNQTPSRRLLLAAAAVTMTLQLAPFAHAQGSFPSKPIRVVVPFAAGTSPDVIARLWGDRLSKLLEQPVVIDNKPGASTIIGAQAVAGAPGDGYTLLYTVNNTLSINPFIYTRLPYKVDDFAPVLRLASVPYVVSVSANSKIRNLDDLISAAKARPGQMSYGSYGIGQGTHVAMARLLGMAGLTMTHVPYKDSAITDLISERIDVLADASTTIIPQVKGGKVRALAVTSAQRVEALPGVPAVAETLPGFVGDSWHGLLVPKGTPAETIATLATASRKVIESSEFRATLRDYGLIPVGGTTADFQKFLVEDAKGWAKVVKDNNVKAE